jgi:phage-related protein
MGEIADKFAAMPDGAEKTAMAVDLFGKAGTDMILMLNGGSQAINGLMLEAEKFGQVVTQEAGQSAAKFNENLDRLKGTFGTLAGVIATAALPHLSAFTDWLIANIPNIAAGVKGFLDFAAGVVQFGAAVATHIGNAITAFQNFQQASRDMGEAFRQSIIDAVNAIRALPAQMVQIGKDIVAGLWEGISSAAAGLKEKVTGIASGIKDSFTGFFQIRSPSRVMMEVGGHIIGGLNDGMSAMQGQSQNIAESIGSTIGNAFKGVIDGSKSVKDAVKEELSSIVSMMANNAIKSLIGGIGGGKGGGGFLGSLFGGLMGFANGGSFQVGGAGGVDSQLVAFKASPNERVSITKPGQSDGMGGAMAVDVRVAVDDEGGLRAYVAKQTSASETRMARNVPRAIDGRNNQAKNRGVRG